MKINNFASNKNIYSLVLDESDIRELLKKSFGIDIFDSDDWDIRINPKQISKLGVCGNGERIFFEVVASTLNRKDK